VLAHVAGLHARVRTAYDSRLPATGWGLSEALRYAVEFTDLVEELRLADPQLFSYLPHTRYGGSILSRHDLVRQIVLDSHGVLVTAAHACHCPMPPDLDLHRDEKATGLPALLKEHSTLVQIATAVVAGWIIWLFGWTK
jgi:hypothetical protein